MSSSIHTERTTPELTLRPSPHATNILAHQPNTESDLLQPTITGIHIILACMYIHNYSNCMLVVFFCSGIILVVLTTVAAVAAVSIVAICICKLRHGQHTSQGNGGI